MSPEITWHTSSRSNSQGNCVQVAAVIKEIALSKQDRTDKRDEKWKKIKADQAKVAEETRKKHERRPDTGQTSGRPPGTDESPRALRAPRNLRPRPHI
jgi:hypothetical protein